MQGDHPGNGLSGRPQGAPAVGHPRGISDGSSGQVAGRGTRKWARLEAPQVWLLAAPLIFLTAALFYPLAKMLVVSLKTYDVKTIIGDQFTLAHYTKLFLDPFYQRIILKTLRLGAIVAVICLLLSYPIAYYLARSNGRAKGWLIFLLLAPLMVGIVVRTYGWIILLGESGSVNSFLVGIGLIERPVRLLFTDLAVIIGLVEVLMPFMVLPLISSLQKIDPSLEYAASTLGANPIQVFWRVVLPLSLPGVISGTLIVFTMAAGAIVTPAVLGGPQMQTVGTLIYQVMTTTVNWPFGSALAFALLLLEALPIFLVFALSSRKDWGR